MSDDVFLGPFCACGDPPIGHYHALREIRRGEFVRVNLDDGRTLVEFKRRVSALLREIEWEYGGHEDACPVCFARSTGPLGHPIPKIHRPDCALAALLSECESALWPALSQVELAENPLPEQRDAIARERRRLQGG